MQAQVLRSTGKLRTGINIQLYEITPANYGGIHLANGIQGPADRVVFHSDVGYPIRYGVGYWIDKGALAENDVITFICKYGKGE
jgi:hypothetical protein